MLQYFPVKEEALQRIQTCTEEDHSCHNVAVTRRCCHQTLLSHEVAVTTLLSPDVAVTRRCCHTRLLSQRCCHTTLLSHEVAVTRGCCHTTLSHNVAVTRRYHTTLLSHDVVTQCYSHTTLSHDVPCCLKIFVVTSSSYYGVAT